MRRPTRSRSPSSRRLSECDYEITKQVCDGAKPGECSTKIEVKGNPTDDDCKQMLVDVDGMIMPLQMAKPGLQKPSRCVVQ